MLKKLLKQGPTRSLRKFLHVEDGTGSIRGRRLVALRRAAISATNPEFKTLWSEKLYELAAVSYTHLPLPTKRIV